MVDLLGDLQIAHLEPADLDQVVEIESRAFTSPWQRVDFERALRRENALCLVARSRGDLVGYAVGFVGTEELHIVDLAIAPERHRQGIGGALLDALTSQSRDLSAKVASLEVRSSNDEAIGLYQSRGFLTVAMRRNYYHRPKEDALVMLKPLEGALSDWVTARSFRPDQPDIP